MSPARRAFTLLEALLGAALGVIGLSLVVWALVPTLRAARLGTLQVALQQAGSLVLQRLSADVSRTAWPGLSLGPSQLAVHRLDQVAVDGRQLWEPTLAVYWLEQGRLGRKEVPRPTAGSPCLLNSTALQAAVAAPGVSSRWLAQDVTEFDVQAQSGPSRTLRLRLVLQAQAPGRNAPERVELSRVQVLRNRTL